MTLRAVRVWIWGSGALERGHGAPFESLAQRGDALGGVGALLLAEPISPDTAKAVGGEAANGGEVFIGG